jgi:hypothetical protein
LGEFVANIAIGFSASIMTLIVGPSLADKSAGAGWIAAGGVAATILIAIFAFAVRLMTEERQSDKAKERATS